MATPSTTRVREALLEPLRRTLSWLEGLRGADGRIVCPWHKVEHTGSNAGLIVLACELLRHDPGRDEKKLLRIARVEAQRLVANLVREGDSACHTFRPGRHDPFNCSNSVIDGGACADALAQLVLEHGDALEPAERTRFRDAALLHARTYLRYAVLDKGIPAQRAWGLTGLASAWALEHDSALEHAALEAVGMLEGIQHADGSYPYHPLEWGAGHKGASDVSSFYQSRVSAFLAWSLERLGREPFREPFASQLARGLEFALALQAPDGVKCGLVEAKPWYWGASYEVASHPFDVYAFAAGARHLRRESYARAALAAYQAWIAHLAPSGEPRDHQPGDDTRRSYQCPIFWAGHASWIARALPELEHAASLAPLSPAQPARGIDLSLRWFSDAQLARLENGVLIAWVRGARPASNVNHGSPRGAGLLRVFDKRIGVDLLQHTRELAGDFEWTGTASSSFARGWKSGASELRFSLWTARVHRRAGRTAEALREPWRAWREGVSEFASARVSSAWALAPTVEAREHELVVRTPLAYRDGTPVADTLCERRYLLEGDALVVDETLHSSGTVKELAYALPAWAKVIERDARHVRCRLP